MAGDWIPMRLDLHEDPAVIHMSELLGCEEDLIVGYLHRIWSWASRQTETGQIPNLKVSSLKRVANPEFLNAMLSAEWLIETDGGLEFPNFDRWLGNSAKKRILDSRRKRISRASESVGKTSEKKRTSVRIPSALRRTIEVRDSETCQYCGARKGDPREPEGKVSISIDHVIPVSAGGPTSEENLVVACSSCNRRKSNRTPAEAGLELSETCPNSVRVFLDKRRTTVQERRGDIPTEYPPSPTSPPTPLTGGGVGGEAHKKRPQVRGDAATDLDKLRMKFEVQCRQRKIFDDDERERLWQAEMERRKRISHE